MTISTSASSTTSGRRGLLYQGTDFWRDPSSLQALLVQLSVLLIVLLVSAFYHFVLRRPPPSSRSSPSILQSSKKQGLLDERIATVHRLFVYPIKSCAAVELTRANLSPKGFELDRRWIIVRLKPTSDGSSKLQKISLREEPRLTLIQPHIDEGKNLLRVSISEFAKQGKNLPSIEVPLRASRGVLEGWDKVPKVEMWGDEADAREVRLVDPLRSEWKGSPSEWISEFLTYPVLLLQFDPYTPIKRQNFPIFKPPHDLSSWDEGKREGLQGLRPIEFQDEYPLLVATQESVDAINTQISRAISDPTTDGDSGPSIKMFDASRYAHLLGGKEQEREQKQEEQNTIVSVLRFRPNILLKGLKGKEGTVQGYSEDSWERIWIEEEQDGEEGEGEKSKRKEKGRKADIALVARCKRCLLTTVDPITAEKDASLPLAFLRRSRRRDKTLEGEKKMGPCWGCYGVVLPVGSTSWACSASFEKGGRGKENKERRAIGKGEVEKQGYGEINVGDAVWVRWRPLEEDDEPERRKRWEERMSGAQVASS